MKKLIYITLIILGFIVTISACQDDLGVTSKEGANVDSPVTVALQFGVPASSDIQISRAGDEEIVISSIRIYVFDGEKFLGSDDVDLNSQPSSDNVYTGTATLYEGTQMVYAIANPASSSYWQDPTTELDAAAGEGKSAFLNTLYKMSSNLVGTNVLPTFVSSNIPLSGKGEVRINGGRLVKNYNIINLKRPYAAINFTIVTEQTIDGKTITFIPQTYTLHNAPSQSYVMEEETDEREEISNPDEFYTVHTETIGVPADNKASFGFYVPENIQSYKQECSDFNKRDAFDGQAENKTWTYAPNCGTYIVIEGQYEEDAAGHVTRYGDVSYTIHLGDFSKEGSMSDFSIRRNYRYNYTMRVLGVENIVVEAETDTEEQPSAEGDIVDLDDYSELFNLDSHYEQIYVEYNLSDIVQNIRNEVANEGTNISDERLNELIAQNFLLSISTPMNTRTGSEPIRPYSGTDEATDMEGVDYQWVEFYSQNTRNAITSYTVTTEEAMLSPWNVCKLMGDAVKQIYNGGAVNVENLHTVNDTDGDIIAPFTVFVDEYVYTKDLAGNRVGWDSYTRKSPRTLMIASDMHISEDLNSTYSTVLTYITQTSIETFYSPASAQTTNALGIETYNEYGLISHSGGDNVGFGTNMEGSTTDNSSNGRANMLTNIGWNGNNNWNTYIDFTKVGYLSDNTGSGNIISALNTNNTNSAYKACLSRNRDLNRNGKIDDDEVRWYLPAINQYLRIGIGTQSLSAEARLYTGAKSDLTNGDYPDDFLDRGALYYTNTLSGNFYWAIEVGAYGSTNDNSAQIRCVRNLAKTDLVNGDETPVDDDALAEAVYGSAPYRLRSGNYMFNFGDRLDVSIFRMVEQEGPYIAHNEDDDANMLPQAFVVSEDYMPGLYRYTQIWNSSIYNDPCRTYSEERNGTDRGSWRTPNLSELMVMATVAGTIGLRTDINTYSRTQFSNQGLRHGFYYNTSGIITTSNGEIGSNGGYVRCVRDATSDEIAESGN